MRRKGGSATAAVFSSHHFPATEADHLVPERTREIAFTPTGQQVTAMQKKDDPFKPQASIKANGTYVGFAESVDTFADTTRTNKEGIAEIKIIHDGEWLLIAQQEENDSDAAECDLKSWLASLTFEIH